VAIEQVLARVDVEAGASVLMQGTESDELGAHCGGAPAPVVPLQVREQRNPFLPGARVRTFSSRSQARMVGEGKKDPANLRAAGAKARRLVESKTR
jgi:hypothetical protein